MASPPADPTPSEYETWPPLYERDGEYIVQAYRLLTGNVLRFMATNVRREHTGIHAVLKISMNYVTIAYTNCNIERAAERTHLGNAALKQIEGADLDKAEMPPNLFHKSLDSFCEHLWDEAVSVSVGGLMEGDPDTPPARPLIGSYVLKDASTILFAPPSMGKSYTAMAMAVSCRWGIDRIWKLGDAWMPLYVNVERSASSMASRLAGVNRALGLDPRTPIPFLNARGKSLSDIYEAAKRTIDAEGCQWVIYDSISRAGFGSLVGDDTANKVCDMLNSLCETWLALGHSPRADEGHIFGSQMFDAAADLTVQLRAQTALDGKSTGIGLQVTAANDGPKGGPMQVHVFEWGDSGLVGIRRGVRGEYAELEASQKRSRESMAMEYLLSVGEATAGEVADHIGWVRNKTSEMLNGAKWALKERRGKEMYYRVRDTFQANRGGDTFGTRQASFESENVSD